MAPDMFPVRVLVETVRTQHCLGCAHDGNPLVDTFAVVGGQTMLCQLVETVLSALGLPQLVQDSKGLIQINGWKPISFDTITDNPEELVTNLFREISTHITLKILAKRSSEPNGQCLAELKHRLLKTAIEKQPHILTTSNGQVVKEILQQVIQGDQQCSTWNNREQTEAVNEWLEQMAAQQQDGENGGSRKGPLCTTKFSPLSELPRLERWFRSDSNPPRQKLLNYMNILNSSPYRRANNKVSYQQICNWFINQRRQQQAAAKQQQSSSAAQQQQRHQQPIAMLPLNATGTAANHNNNNTTMFNSLAAALANGTMDPVQIQQKMATIFAGIGGEDCTTTMETASMQRNQQIPITMDHSGSSVHQIPLANGLPMNIRSKFDGTPITADRENCTDHQSGSTSQQEGQHGSGRHSDRMDGGSESPAGNDDMSEHSGTSGGGPADGARDSMAHSPTDDMSFMDVQPQPSSTVINRPTMLHNAEHESLQQQQSKMQSIANGVFHEEPNEAVQFGQAAIKLSQLLRSDQQTPPPPQPPAPPPPPNSTAAMAAAAAAAFQTLMPTQQHMQLMNQLALASQFHPCLSPSTPQPPPIPNVAFGNGPSTGGGSSTIKSSPSSNSLSTMFREETNGAGIPGGSGGTTVKSEVGDGVGCFSSPSQTGANGSSQNGTGSNSSQSRSRLMFDPLSELPILERWFEENPHPGWLQIEQYTDFLNSMAYRQNYPPISTHNVKIWFKNRRAKTKRLLSNNDALTAATASSLATSS